MASRLPTSTDQATATAVHIPQDHGLAATFVRSASSSRTVRCGPFRPMTSRLLRTGHERRRGTLRCQSWSNPGCARPHRFWDDWSMTRAATGHLPALALLAALAGCSSRAPFELPDLDAPASASAQATPQGAYPRTGTGTARMALWPAMARTATASPAAAANPATTVARPAPRPHLHPSPSFRSRLRHARRGSNANRRRRRCGQPGQPTTPPRGDSKNAEPRATASSIMHR